MVAQIGLVSSDIRSRIENIGAFSLLKLEGKGSIRETGTSTEGVRKPSYGMRLVMPLAYIQRKEAIEPNQKEKGETTTTTIATTATTATTSTTTTATNAIMTSHNEFEMGKSVTFMMEEHTSLPIRDYFHLIDQQRSEKVRKIKELFESIGPVLIKLESLILGTFTGESSKMKLCYAYWEKELFGLLIRYGRG